MSFDIKAALSDKDMGDIVTTGFESGSYGSVLIKAYSKPSGLVVVPEWADYPDARHCWWWAVGSITVVDRYGDGKKGLISRKSLQRGLAHLGEKYPHLLAQLVSGDYDVIPADALLQAAAFGEVIYG
jgi:hypothetical protein